MPQILIRAIMWKNLENIMLNEILSKNSSCCMILFTQNFTKFIPLESYFKQFLPWEMRIMEHFRIVQMLYNCTVIKCKFTKNHETIAFNWWSIFYNIYENIKISFPSNHIIKKKNIMKWKSILWNKFLKCFKLIYSTITRI